MPELPEYMVEGVGEFHFRLIVKAETRELAKEAAIQKVAECLNAYVQPRMITCTSAKRTGAEKIRKAAGQ